MRCFVLLSLAFTPIFANAFGAQQLLHDQYPDNHDNQSKLAKWKDCGTLNDHKLECARIDVPANHFNRSSSEETFSIPLIRMLGKNATANGNRTILLNPGGPGGSGVGFLYRTGDELNKIIGENFHLLGFDPRGVNGSIPQAICFAPQQRKEKFSIQFGEIDCQAGEMFTAAENNAKACNESLGDLGAYLNTPQTAADMNHILDAIGQDDMYYYGFSYGTTLGQTYAQMFPDRVKRLVIDGVSDQDLWYNAFGIDGELSSTDDVFFGFIKECFKAKDNCPLNSVNGQSFRTSDELQSYVDEFLQTLEENPIPVYLNHTSFGSVSRRSVVTNGIFPALYAPTRWPILAKDLSDLLNGNPIPAYTKWSELWIAEILKDETGPSVVANDAWLSGPNAPAHGIKGIKDWLLSQPQNSKLLSRYVGSEVYALSSWSIPTTHNHHPQTYPEFPQIRTANPILVLSTTFDPVCPLAAAQHAHNSFEGSGFVEQKAYGHCALSMPSLCTVKHVRQYFHHGILPNPGSTCGIDAEYFPSLDKEAEVDLMSLNAEDHELLLALHELARESFGRVL